MNVDNNGCVQDYTYEIFNKVNGITLLTHAEFTCSVFALATKIVVINISSNKTIGLNPAIRNRLEWRLAHKSKTKDAENLKLWIEKEKMRDNEGSKHVKLPANKMI